MARLIGWREWVALPDLGIDRLRAKADTGARTSALHAVRIRSTRVDDEEWVEFDLDADRTADLPAQCRARVMEHRVVRNSGGQEEQRVVIETTLRMNGEDHPIALTLTDRDSMGYRMLLGRRALADRFIVDAAASYLLRDFPAEPADADHPNEEE